MTSGDKTPQRNINHLVRTEISNFLLSTLNILKLLRLRLRLSMDFFDPRRETESLQQQNKKKKKRHCRMCPHSRKNTGKKNRASKTKKRKN